MTIPTRRTALSLGLGVLALVGRAFGQAPDEEQKGKDKDREKSPKTDDPAVTPASGPAGLIGTVDMNSVMKGYLKVKESGDKFSQDFQARRSELLKMAQRAKRDADDLATLQPGTRDHADLDAKLKKEKA